MSEQVDDVAARATEEGATEPVEVIEISGIYEYPRQPGLLRDRPRWRPDRWYRQ